MSVIVLVLAFHCDKCEAQTTYGAASDGNWSNPAIWTPGGGPPGVLDTAHIGSNSPAGSANTATVTLTGATNVANVSIGRVSGHTGTLDLNGNTLNASGFIELGFGPTAIGSILHNGGTLHTNSLRVRNISSFNFANGDTAGSLLLTDGGTSTTSAVGNIATLVQVFNPNSTLNLGANLVLSQDLDVRGLGANTATVNANGFDITARDIFVGRFGNHGQITNQGVITATRDLESSGSSFSLGANDSVANQVRATSGGTLNLHANTAAQSGQVTFGATMNTAATSNLATFVNVLNENSTLNLGANLVLSQDLDVRGTGANTATVNANGFDITARDIFVGRFGNHGQITNRGVITATRDLESSGSSFSLGANDSVANQVRATSGGTLNLHANTAAQSGQVTFGATMNTAATSNLATFVNVLNENSTLNLGANLVLSQDVDVRGTGASTATVNANGFDITARDIFVGRFGNHGQITNRGVITATRDLESSGSSFSLGANDSVANQVRATSGGTLNLHANTAAQSGQVTFGGTMNTAATSNLATFVNVLNENSTLNLGANLVLSQDLDVRGTGANTATVNANGFDITADRIFMGRFDHRGSLINDGAITANQLLFDRSDLTLTGGNDTIHSILSVVDNSSLNIMQSLGEMAGLTFNGNSLTIDATSTMVLDFDAQLNPGLDWAFRWINPTMGDRVSTLGSLLSDGRIIINSPVSASIFDGGDGYTYIGYNAIPEPSSCCLGLLAIGVFVLHRQRRRSPRR